ncbi:MAG: TRAP transporter TatT component family protein [Pseudomonadota bacterium]|nr:TRAP transporter TatT component family protein [Pseudomonadota bacterium]
MRVLPLLLLLACGKQIGTYQVEAPAAAATTADQKSALKAEADGLWNERGDKAKLQAALVKYEQVYTMDATDREVAGRLVRGWYFLGDGHELEKDAKLSAWSTSIEWGKKCLAINTEFTGLLAKGDEDEASAARAFTKDDVPCLYWTSSALGKWAKLTGLTTTLKHLPTVKAYMTRVGELEPTYYYSGPDRYWGVFYAALPSFAGQDLTKSKEYFDKAISAQPDFFGNRVLFAENWATKTQNKADFEAALNGVLAASPTVLPDILPEMESEQRKAKVLLENKGNYFAD